MNSYRIKYRYNPTGLIKVFTVDAKSEEDAKAIIVSDWDGVVMECVQLDNTDKEIWLRQRKDLIERIDRLTEERNELKTENMTIIAKGTKAIRECQDEKDQLEMRLKLYRRVSKDREDAYDMLLKANTKQIELSNDLLDQRDDLESSLNTSRYFIYLSGMCGFVLGLACLYLVV